MSGWQFLPVNLFNFIIQNSDKRCMISSTSFYDVKMSESFMQKFRVSFSLEWYGAGFLSLFLLGLENLAQWKQY